MSDLKILKSVVWFLAACQISVAQQTATIRESSREFKTYSFSNPDPTPPSKTIYPYYRFNGFTNQAVQKTWKTIELENQFLKITILPEIGGKIWDAVDKKTGRSFIYNNEVVKFRDIAMRGPWTSGGIEPNYGIIGHTPNCATPVDYIARNNPDGSVSCFIGTLDLLTQTWWTIEVRLPKDKAWFTTNSFWQNSHNLEQPYYTWMNTGIPVGNDLEFIYPGNQYLGHEGDFYSWPLNLREHKNISRYSANDFGSYKSYHVFGRYTNFFGAYWHGSDQGMGRYSLHDEKAGKKIWIWGLSRQGMIWEKLLTDTNGQYAEVQSGRLFNQTGDGSSKTPFKHFGFEPYQTDTWQEYWFPVHGTRGFVHADPDGAFNVVQKDGKLRMVYQALQEINGTMKILSGGLEIYKKSFYLKTQEIFKDSIPNPKGLLEVYLNDRLLYENQPTDGLSRPLETPVDFDWNTANGLWLLGKEAERSRNYDFAEQKYRQSLEVDRYYSPALAGMAGIYLRKADYPRARVFAMRGLSIDTYDPDCNYAFAMASAGMGNKSDVKDGFDIAALSFSHRSAAYTQLSKWYVSEHQLSEAIHYAKRSLENNSKNIEALQILAASYRLIGDQENATSTLQTIEKINPLNHFVRLERWITSKSDSDKNDFIQLIRNELRHETYLHYANWYTELNLFAEAEQVLSVAPGYSEVLYWKAFIGSKLNKQNWNELLDQADRSKVNLVFPSRLKSLEVMQWAEGQTQSWKPRYYQALMYRALGLLQQAKDLINDCAESPDEAPFYALRSELFPEKAEADLKKAINLDSKEWIYAKKIFDVLIKDYKVNEALALVNNYRKLYPENSNLIMLTAKAMVLNRHYNDCNKLLSAATILPYEGSTEARQIYWHSLMLNAAEQLNRNKPADALESVKKALEWPEQLGVGKPYESEIDLRPELLMQYLCFRRMSKQKETENIAAQIHSKRKTETSIGKWSAVLLTLTEKGKEAAILDLNKWKPSETERTFWEWCVERLRSGALTTDPKQEQLRLANLLLSLSER